MDHQSNTTATRQIGVTQKHCRPADLKASESVSAMPPNGKENKVTLTELPIREVPVNVTRRTGPPVAVLPPPSNRHRNNTKPKSIVTRRDQKRRIHGGNGSDSDSDPDEARQTDTDDVIPDSRKKESHQFDDSIGESCRAAIEAEELARVQQQRLLRNIGDAWDERSRCREQHRQDAEVILSRLESYGFTQQERMALYDPPTALQSVIDVDELFQEYLDEILYGHVKGILDTGGSTDMEDIIISVEEDVLRRCNQSEETVFCEKPRYLLLLQNLSQVKKEIWSSWQVRFYYDKLCQRQEQRGNERKKEERQRQKWEERQRQEREEALRQAMEGERQRREERIRRRIEATQRRIEVRRQRWEERLPSSVDEMLSFEDDKMNLEDEDYLRPEIGYILRPEDEERRRQEIEERRQGWAEILRRDEEKLRRHEDKGIASRYLNLDNMESRRREEIFAEARELSASTTSQIGPLTSDPEAGSFTIEPHDRTYLDAEIAHLIQILRPMPSVSRRLNFIEKMIMDIANHYWEKATSALFDSVILQLLDVGSNKNWLECSDDSWLEYSDDSWLEFIENSRQNERPTPRYINWVTTGVGATMVQDLRVRWRRREVAKQYKDQMDRIGMKVSQEFCQDLVKPGIVSLLLVKNNFPTGIHEVSPEDLAGLGWRRESRDHEYWRCKPTRDRKSILKLDMNGRALGLFGFEPGSQNWIFVEDKGPSQHPLARKISDFEEMALGLSLR